VEGISNLYNRGIRNRNSGKVDGKHASCTRHVAGIDSAVIRFDAPPAEREADAETGSIGAALLERAEQFVDVPVWEAATCIVDLDEHAFGVAADS
jgi:hypothetical protein